MVSLQIENGVFRVEVCGLHKLWALKSQLSFFVALGTSICVEHMGGWSPNAWRTRAATVPSPADAQTSSADRALRMAS